MAITTVLTILGDANIKRNMTSLNVESREVLKECQVLNFSRMLELEEELAKVSTPYSDFTFRYLPMSRSEIHYP
jgi:hypothetical protein